MLARVLSAAFSLKASVVPAALIVAGALISTAPESDVAARDADTPETAVVVLEAPPLPSPAVPAAPSGSPRRSDPPAAPSPTPSPARCTIDATTRADALARIRSAFDAHHDVIDRLMAERHSSRVESALTHAHDMLDDIDRTAEQLVTTTTCAADATEVAERATHAMEMIADLARSATAATPTPRPTPTPRSRGRHYDPPTSFPCTRTPRRQSAGRSASDLIRAVNEGPTGVALYAD